MTLSHQPTARFLAAMVSKRARFVVSFALAASTCSATPGTGPGPGPGPVATPPSPPSVPPPSTPPPIPPPSPPQPPARPYACLSTCNDGLGQSGVCDDGLVVNCDSNPGVSQPSECPSSATAANPKRCDIGSDCADCGTREICYTCSAECRAYSIANPATACFEQEYLVRRAHLVRPCCQHASPARF